MSSEKLTEWYKQINEEDILPNGAIRIKVPVLDTGNGRPHGFPPVLNHPTDGGAEVPSDQCPDKEELDLGDPNKVETKDKINSMKVFFLTKQMQSLLVQVSGLLDPYGEDSIEKENLLDEIKNLYDNIGKIIPKL